MTIDSTSASHAPRAVGLEELDEIHNVDCLDRLMHCRPRCNCSQSPCVIANAPELALIGFISSGNAIPWIFESLISGSIEDLAEFG